MAIFTKLSFQSNMIRGMLYLLPDEGANSLRNGLLTLCVLKHVLHDCFIYLSIC